MSAGKVNGPTPSDPGKDVREQSQQHRRVEKVERISKVSETENEQTRKKFNRFMEDEPEQDSSRAPSPLETDFYSSAAPNPPPELADLENSAVPSPSSSPPPNVTDHLSMHTEEPEPHGLPQSETFWEGADSPAEHEPKHIQYKEVSHPPAAKELHDKKGKKQAAPFQGPKEDFASQKTKKEKEAAHREKQKKVAIAFTQDVKSEFRSGKTKETLPKNLPAKTTKEEKQMPMLPDAKTAFAAHAHMAEPSQHLAQHLAQHKGDSGEEREKKSQVFEILSDMSSSLPSHIAPLAMAAVTQSAPYLSPQIIPLFFQMVGTIYVMTAPPGISRTEIVLNSPSFANSKFFGAKISIEKYATAPDSLNIRLTGSDEAVKAFNQNIPNLYAAFQNGNFSFRIGRLSVEYSIEKPIFHRKDRRGGTGGGGEFQDRREPR